MNPCIVLDIETTGIPSKPRGWEPRVIELGSVVVTAAGDVVEPASCIVWQPEEHLRDPRATPAFALSDLTPEIVLRDGRDEERLAIRFACWVGKMMERHGVREVRAFNQSFDFGFLSRTPWNLQATGLGQGACIMLAAMGIMGPAGALPQWENGEYKWPKSSEAEEFFRSRGHRMDYPGTPHRALRDAGMEALIAVAIARERGEL